MNSFKRWARNYAIRSGIRTEKIDQSIRLRCVVAIVGILMALAYFMFARDPIESLVLGLYTFFIMEYIVYCYFDCFKIERFQKLYTIRWLGCILAFVLLISGVVLHFAVGTEEPVEILIMEVLFAVSQVLSVRSAMKARKYSKYTSVH